MMKKTLIVINPGDDKQYLYYELSGPYDDTDCEIEHIPKKSDKNIESAYVDYNGKLWFCPIMIECETEYKALT